MKNQDTVPLANDEEVMKISTFLIDHIESQIRLADTKAQLTLAADALLVGITASLRREITDTLLKPIASLSGRLIALEVSIMILVLIGSFFFALLAVRPHSSKLRAHSRMQIQTDGREHESLLYYGNISRFSSVEDFTRAFERQTSDELRHSFLGEIYAKSRIARDKFTRVRWSITFLIATIILWFVQLLLTLVFR